MQFDSATLLGMYALAMGYGTEGGATPYRLITPPLIPGTSSGYSMGVIQIDFGKQTQDINTFVNAIEQWANQNGVAGLSSVVQVEGALASNIRTGLVALQQSDVNLINQWAAVPANQAYFFKTFEAPFTSTILQGSNGVAAFTQTSTFQQLPVDEQINIVTMLEKAGNQGGPGALHTAIALLNDIPVGQLSENSALIALTGDGSPFGETLVKGIIQASVTGDVLAQINASPLLSPLLSSAFSLNAYDTSTVTSNPSSLFVSTLLRTAVSETASGSDV
jgi:hypothetical protein